MSSSTSSFRRYLWVWLAAAVVLLAAALAATEWLVRSHVEPNDNLPRHIGIFRAATQPVAAFGDSHMACGFDPADAAVNLGFPGESVENVARKIAAYGKRVRLTHVIVQADAHMFARYRASEVKGYNEHFESDGGDRPVAAAVVRSLAGYHRPKVFAYWRVWLLRGTFENRIRVESNGSHRCAGRWSDLDPGARRRLASERAALHQPMSEFPDLPFAVRYAETLRDLARSGVRVCMVEFPVTAEYTEALSGETVGLIRQWFARQALASGAKFLAHRDLYRAEPGRFVDTDHLSPSAAAAFARQVLAECLRNPESRSH